MPEQDDVDFDDEDESAVIRDLRRKAKRADEAEARLAKLETELALSKAGLNDLTPARQKALLAAHEGDMTGEALRETAIDLGFATKEVEPEPEPQVPAEEIEAHERAQAATAGAEPSDAHPTKLDDLIAGAKTEAELDQILANAGIAVNASE